MKPKLFLHYLLSFIFLVCLLAFHIASAQTNAMPPIDNTSFFASAQSYFTSFNPEFETTFTANKGAAWTGISSVQGAGVPLQNEIGISYSIWKRMEAEVVIRDSGVTGGLVSAQAGLGVSAIVHDVKLTGYAHGGANLAKEVQDPGPFAEIGVRIQKAMTTHTFTGLGAAIRFPGATRIFTLYTGFVF